MDEEVTRQDRRVTVRIGPVKAILTYSSNSDAKKAERRLLMSMKARENFFRPTKGRRSTVNEEDGR